MDDLQTTSQAIAPAAKPRDETILTTWYHLHKAFCGWRGQFWRNLIGRNHGWGVEHYGDPIKRFLKHSHWRALRETCEPLSDEDIDFLRVLAQQKFEHSAAAFRLNAVLFVTIPVSLLVVINQIAPKTLPWLSDYFFREAADSRFGIIGDIVTYAGLLIGILMSVGFLFNAVYKARELRMALEIEAARRRLLRGETLGSAGGDVTDISL